MTCRYASIVQGSITSCSEFLHRAHPSLYHLEDIAWVLRTDVRRGQIGFVRSKDMPLTERFVVDEE